MRMPKPYAVYNIRRNLFASTETMLATKVGFSGRIDKGSPYRVQGAKAGAKGRVWIRVLVPLSVLFIIGATLAACSTDGPANLGAYITSKHAVYTVGDGIDITFWVRKSENPVVPTFEICDSNGRVVQEKVVGGQTFATTKKRGNNTEVVDGRIPPGENYLETCEDVHRWYDISKPGAYTLRFFGKESLANGEVRRIVSNTLTIFVRDRADPNDRTIPLNEIWALQMPGTRPMNVTMRGDPSDYESPEGPLVAEILETLAYDPHKHPTADSGFAVSGTGMEALRETHAVLVQGKPRKKSFQVSEPISLVFFSYSFGSYVHLVGAEQRDNVIQLLYRLVPHRTKEMTAHLALVPVPKLVNGSIPVEIKPQIVQNTFGLDWAKWIPQIVCESFVFKIEQRKQKVVP